MQLCVCGSLPHTSRLQRIQGIIKTLKCLFVSGPIAPSCPQPPSSLAWSPCFHCHPLSSPTIYFQHRGPSHSLKTNWNHIPFSHCLLTSHLTQSKGQSPSNGQGIPWSGSPGTTPTSQPIPYSSSSPSWSPLRVLHLLLPLLWTFTLKYPRGCFPHLPQVPSSHRGLPWPFHTEPWHSFPPWLLGPSLLCSPENRASVWQSLNEYLLYHWRNDASQCPRPPAQTQRNSSPSVPWCQHGLTLGSRVCLRGGGSQPGKKENCSLDHPNLLKARTVWFNGKCQRVW